MGGWLFCVLAVWAVYVVAASSFFNAALDGVGCSFVHRNDGAFAVYVPCVAAASFWYWLFLFLFMELLLQSVAFQLPELVNNALFTDFVAHVFVVVGRVYTCAGLYDNKAIFELA